MQVPRGTTFRAAATVAALLESDLEFYNTLTPRGGRLDFYGAVDSIDGQLEIWWSIEIEARDWGIKDISPFVKKLRLTGWTEEEDERGRMREGQPFSYEYPEQTPKEIGPDVDAPTPDNVVRLATPKWKVDYRVDPDKKSRTTFAPSAEVDVTKRTIEILF